MKHLDLKSILLIFLAFTYAAVAGFYPINRGMVNQVDYITTSGGTTTALATGNQVKVFEGSSAQTLKLPDATSLPIDWWYEVLNNATSTVTVTDNGGSTIIAVAAGERGKVFLKARANSAGTWKGQSNVSSADLTNYFAKSDFISTSAGAGDAGKPIKTGSDGFLDPALVPSFTAGISQLLGGDVTTPAGGGTQVATIQPLAVTNSKIANSTIDLTAKVTGVLPNANTTASSSAGNSTIVARDGSGNFAAGTITATLAGNASTASALAADPSDCSAGTKATGIAANGNLTCSAVSMTADVSGTLQPGNGGTGQTSAASSFTSFYETVATTLGDIIYGGTSGAPTRLAGDTSNTKKFLSEISSGGVAAAPSWNTIATSDVVLPTTFAIASSNTQATIDWNKSIGQGGIHTHTMGGNMTFTFANPVAGQTIVVRLTNNGSNYTASFADARLKWPSGSAPTLTTGAKSDVFTFMYDGTTIFGNAVQSF